MFFEDIFANFPKFEKKTCLDISKIHFWLKFLIILRIFVAGSGLQREMYIFLKKIWAIFWPVLVKTWIPANKTLNWFGVVGKLPSMRSLGELGSILLWFSRFLEVPPVQNEKIITLFTRVSNLSASCRFNHLTLIIFHYKIPLNWLHIYQK